jgi:hypothetical protein
MSLSPLPLNPLALATTYFIVADSFIGIGHGGDAHGGIGAAASEKRKGDSVDLEFSSAQADRLVMESKNADIGAAVPTGEPIASTQPSVCIL